MGPLWGKITPSPSMMMLELIPTLLVSRERKGGVKEQLVRLKGKEQLKVMVARPQRRAWTPTKRHHSMGTSAPEFLSTSVFPGRGGVKNMCDLALKETCQPFNLLSKVDF